MEKIYNPHDIEQYLYDYWEQHNCFSPSGDKSKGSFCIVIPPPNITGGLHMGHAFQQTIMDVMIRYQRMQGKNTLWQIGTDHAGIATQMIVERNIAAEEGKTRHDYGRDAFVAKIWQWKAELRKTIIYQMRRLGLSVDWKHERFTMDEGFSNAVKKVFVRLYREGLIYNNKRLVNWDPKLCTAISDLEVEHRKSKGFIWYIRYPLADGLKTMDGKDYLVISTTRPETILGNTGIAVNPKDPRYKYFIGKFVMLPLTNRRIPIVGDEYVDMNKGTGCMNITPAHDFNDYEISCRHQLPIINILTFEGNIRESAEVFDAKGNEFNAYSTVIPAKFRNLERFTARNVIVTTIDALGLLENIVETHDLIVPYGDRSGVIIEPMLTNQWYVRANMLAKPAIEAVKNGDIRFVPKQYENMYFSWMHNIQDWCISRQLWWGHRIPAWYDEQGNMYVAHNEEEVRYDNSLSNNIVLRQDENVLDTWFSSALWTFSTLGWPENIDLLRQFHPTSVIVSSFDIIFFWIARMIMMTMHFVRDKNNKPQVPFNIVYMTGLIRDNEGQKMSKSKGNVIDPLDIVDGISLTELLKKRTCNMMQPQLAGKIRKNTEKQFPHGIAPHGTDALRFAMVALTSIGRDIRWDMKHLECYRNFCNKLWNASRFVLMRTKDYDCGFNSNKKVRSLADRWIMSELNQTIKIYREALDSFRFDIAADILYKFTWNQFCDWYIELTKPIINGGSEVEMRGTRHTLITMLEILLRLAHPIIPFITETIWQRVKVIVGIHADTIMLQPFPKFNPAFIDEVSTVDIEWLKQVIVAIRSIRIQMNIKLDKPLELLLQNCSDAVIRRVNKNQKLLQVMACLKSISISSDNINAISATKMIDGAKLLIPIEGIVNKSHELQRLAKEIMQVDTKIRQIKSKLTKNGFITNAPKSLVMREQEKLISLSKTKEQLIEQQAVIAVL